MIELSVLEFKKSIKEEQSIFVPHSHITNLIFSAFNIGDRTEKDIMYLTAYELANLEERGYKIIVS